MTVGKVQKIFACLCVLALFLSTLPLYAIAFDNHPYYDDFGFSASVHQAWKRTGDWGETLSAALASARETRQNWQGTYTGTLFSNLQPGLFSEDMYWIGNWFILTALIVCVAFLMNTAFEKLGLERWARVSLSSLAPMIMIQFMPDVGEAFYWFNGGIGNTFIYALLALTTAFCIRLYHAQGFGVWQTIVLAVLAVAIGGGSYGGGLFALCTGAFGLLWLFVCKGRKRWHFAALYVLMACCFLYSVTAPGNSVRASYIRYQGSPVKTVLQSFYYGIGQMGEYIRLPLIAVTLPVVPALFDAAKKSPYQFRHPWLVLGVGVCLYCTQFAPPLHSIASIGAGRIVNTYFISFVVLWFFYAYYLAGFAARRVEIPQLNVRQMGALLLVSLCVFGTGCLAFRRSGDVLYGAQNMSGPSALLSIVTGEAAQYDREMTAREVLLNDDTQPVITLEPLTVVPAVLMDDLIVPNAVYDARESLCLYYEKDAIHIVGEEGVQ